MGPAVDRLHRVKLLLSLMIVGMMTVGLIPLPATEAETEGRQAGSLELDAFILHKAVKPGDTVEIEYLRGRFHQQERDARELGRGSSRSPGASPLLLLASHGANFSAGRPDCHRLPRRVQSAQDAPSACTRDSLEEVRWKRRPAV